MDTKTKARELLDQLLEEIEATDPELMPPPDKVEKGETLIMTVEDPFIRKLWSLTGWLRREGKRMQVDHEALGMESTDDPEFRKLKDKHDALGELGWWLMRSRYDLWTTNLGIRRDWQLVKIAPKVKVELPPFLRKLLEDNDD